jgi:hypothetical protein
VSRDLDVARLMALFEEALALSPLHRQAFVEQLSGHDAALRDQLHSLLETSRR